MLLLLVPIVPEDLRELRIVGAVDSLVVPVDGLELLHDRHDGAVPVDRGRLKPAFVLVQLCAGSRHWPPFPEPGYEKKLKTSSFTPHTVRSTPAADWWNRLDRRARPAGGSARRPHRGVARATCRTCSACPRRRPA